MFGVPKHQRPLLGAALRRRNGPGQSCKLVDNVTLVKHTHSTPVFHTTSKTHNMPHTIARISARTHQSRPGSWGGSTGLASNRIRSASGSTADATHERSKCGKQSNGWDSGLRCRPLAQIMPLVCVYQSPSSGAPAGSSSSSSVLFCSCGQKRRSNPP